jgi:hypothetical protein
MPWRFFLFTGVLTLILYLHFYLAVEEAEGEALT